MERKVIITILLFATIIGIDITTRINKSRTFESLNPQEMHKRIIKERDYAIKKAVKDGVYKCCIEPPCTMCYMDANKWNNFKAGTCACDSLIAQGKEPCPQCKGLCQKDDKGACKTKQEAEK